MVLNGHLRFTLGHDLEIEKNKFNVYEKYDMLYVVRQFSKISFSELHFINYLTNRVSHYEENDEYYLSYKIKMSNILKNNFVKK